MRLSQFGRPPERKRSPWLQRLALGAVVLIGLGVVGGYAYTKLGGSVPAVSSAAVARPSATATCAHGTLPNGTCAQVAEDASPSPAVSASPVSAAWTPCTLDGAGGTRECDSSSTDSCDWAEYSRLSSGADGKVEGVLDAFIENRALIDANRLKDCPQFLPVWQRSLTGFAEGVNLVPRDVKPGKYQTTAHLGGGLVSDCYWERSRGGKIVANDFVSGSPKVTVTIKQGDDAFTTRGCGDWVKV